MRLCWVMVGGLSTLVACGGGTVSGSEATGGSTSGAVGGGEATGGEVSGGASSGGSSSGGDATAGMASGGEPPCITGDERCPCYPNDTCNDDLTCASDLCVRFPGTGGSGATSAGGTGAGPTSGGGSGGEPGGQPGRGGTAGEAGGQPGLGGSAGLTGGQPGAGGAEGGSGGAGVSCSNVEPCGGDVVGTWIMQGSCLERSGSMIIASMGLGCATVGVVGTVQVSGTWTANADGTYEDQLIWVGEDVLTLAPECLQVSGTTTTCDRIGNPLVGAGYAEGLPYASVHCVDDATSGGCTCTAAIDRSQADGGSYTVANGVITTSDGQAFSYCIEGHTLTMTPQRWSENTSATTTGSAVAELDLVTGLPSRRRSTR